MHSADVSSVGWHLEERDCHLLLRIVPVLRALALMRFSSPIADWVEIECFCLLGALTDWVCFFGVFGVVLWSFVVFFVA